MAEQAVQKTKIGKAEKRATHRLIVDAARRVLMRDGPSAVSTVNIAAEAGVAPNIVKERFRNPDELLLAIAVGELLAVSRAARSGGSETRDWVDSSGDALARVMTIARSIGPAEASANPNEIAKSTPSERNGESAGDIGRRIRALGARQSNAAADLVAALEAASSHLSALEGGPAVVTPGSNVGPPNSSEPGAAKAFLATARQAANEAATARAKSPGRRRNPVARLWSSSSAPGNAKRRGRAFLLACIVPFPLMAAGYFVLHANVNGANLPAIGGAKPATVAESVAHTPLVLASLPQTGLAPLDRLAESAKRGDPKAELLLGLKYLEGDGPARDQSQALHWLQRAAEDGQPLAQYHLGNLYAPEDSVLYNPIEAARWYEAAAGHGNLQAMNNIAVSYAEGSGVAKDPAEAARWFSQAAALGFTTAQFNLAVLYERGDGVPKSAAEAYKWYAIAAARGDEEAQARRDLLKRDLNASELSAAERAAQSFSAEKPDTQANDAPALAEITGG